MLIFLYALPVVAQDSAAVKKQEADESVQQLAETMNKLMRKPTDAEQESMELLGQWTMQLTEYLLNHEQPYAQAIGLNKTNAILQSQATQIDPDTLQLLYQNHGQHINKLVNNETLNIETLQILENLCFLSELDDHCNRQALLDKQMQLYPSDLSVYIRPLQLALETDNQDLTANLLKVMSGTQQMTHVDYLLPEFIALIKDYVKTNPIPEKALIREKNDLIATTDFSEKDIPTMDEKMPDSQVYIMLISMQLALPLPQFKPLKDSCQNNPDYSAECLYIAKTMINHGNTIITKAIGHVINIAVYELNNQQDMLAASQANHERFKQYAECLSKSYSQNNDFVADYFDENYSELWFTAEDELTRLTKIATYLYEKRLTEGADEAVNPETCIVQ
ncbi:hypothetical protein [Marinicella pacifica]